MAVADAPSTSLRVSSDAPSPQGLHLYNRSNNCPRPANDDRAIPTEGSRRLSTHAAPGQSLGQSWVARTALRDDYSEAVFERRVHLGTARMLPVAVRTQAVSLHVQALEHCATSPTCLLSTETKGASGAHRLAVHRRKAALRSRSQYQHRGYGDSRLWGEPCGCRCVESPQQTLGKKLWPGQRRVVSSFF